MICIGSECTKHTPFLVNSENIPQIGMFMTIEGMFSELTKKGVCLVHYLV